jgi:hypothetical protein
VSQNRGYYSLVQFCPDPSRLEGVNIGVVLYSPGERRLQVRITRNNQRIRKFFGNQDWNLVNRAKTSIENQLRSQQFLTVEELESYISKRANIIQISPPRPMAITDLETDIAELHDRLVGCDPVERKRRINGSLTKKLFEAGVVNLVQKSVSVEISDFKKSIRAPYAYQNGRFNLISPVQFDPDSEAIFAKTGKSAIEGQLLYNKPDPMFGEMRLVVVANFDEQIEDSTRQVVKRILDEHRVTLYSFENLAPLVDDIKRSAASHSIPSND